jgi:TatA/E family protein of Tat protein translocase
MGTLGVQEMIIIFLLALVLFGPKKLPELGRTIGKALTEFRRASSDLKATFEREMQTLERESHSLKQATETTANEIYSHSTFDYSYNEQSQVADASHAITDGHESSPDANNPSTVSASEVPGAESNGTTAEPPPTETASVTPHVQPPVEETVPRSGTTEASRQS